MHVASQEASDTGEITDDQDEFQEFDEEYIRDEDDDGDDNDVDIEDFD